jgi:hypothetical protein
MSEIRQLMANKMWSLLESPQSGTSKLETIEIILTVSTTEKDSSLVVLANVAPFYYW